MSTTVNGTTITFSGSGVLTQAIVSNGIGTSYITNIIIDGYTSIGSNAFQSVILFLTSVTIPNTVTSIAANAFSYALYITSISIPSSVTSIGQSAFNPMSSLTAINVALSNTYYGSDINGVLFDVNGTTLIQYPIGSALTSYIIPDGVTTIVENALYGATILTSVTIPSSVTSIGANAFANTNITSIVFTLYATVNLLGLNIGSGQTCYGLTNVTISALDAILFSGSGVLTQTIVSSQLNSSQTTVLISGYTSIGANAFTNTNITSVIIPSSVTSIGQYAFNNTHSITSVIFASGSQLTNIGAFAFSQNTLTAITIPASVTSIGLNAFGLTQITSIVFTLYATVNLLGLNIGSGQICYGLTNVTISALDAILFSGSGVLTQAIVSSQLNSSQTTVLISGYTSIDANAFANAYITSISIPSYVTSIGEYAFNGTNLTSISIPSSVTIIGQNAFSNSSIATINVALGNSYYSSDNSGVLFDVSGTTLIQYPSGNTYLSYSIPSTVTTIEQYAFQYSSYLSQIVIPASVQTIGIYAFFNNISLTTIVFENNSNLTNIGNYAFASSPSTSTLTSINIPASVQTIGDYAFQYSNLSTITFDGNSVLANIGNFAFSYSNISEIIIPSSVQTIGSNAFYLCVPLETIQIDLSSNLITIGDNAFSGTHITAINIPASVQTIGNNAFNGVQNLKVYSQYINNLNLIEQTYSNFYGARNAQVILYDAPIPPQPPVPSPQYQSNGYGPIQICNSRLANCNITKTNFQNGYVMNNRATAIQRISTLISVQSQMRNATWTQIYAPINAYTQRAGGPVGYGQSPRNTF